MTIFLPANGTFPDGASGRRRTALTQWPFSYASPWPERNEKSNSYYYRNLIFHRGHYDISEKVDKQFDDH